MRVKITYQNSNGEKTVIEDKGPEAVAKLKQEWGGERTPEDIRAGAVDEVSETIGEDPKFYSLANRKRRIEQWEKENPQESLDRFSNGLPGWQFTLADEEQ